MSNIVHSARPLTTSHSSFVSSGRAGARSATEESSERKENILEPSRSQSASRSQLLDRAATADTAVRKEDEAVAHAFCIRELMNRHNERTPLGDDLAQHRCHFAGLLEIEAVERLIHEEQRMRREQRKRPHEPPAISFRQGVDALAQDGRQSGGGDRIHDVRPRSSVSAGKEDERTPDVLVMPRSGALRQVEQASVTIDRLKWRAA